MSYKNEIYAVVDLETTGSSYRKGHKIFQIGISLIQDKQLIQDYNVVVNPGQTIPPLIRELTGFSNKDVRDAPYFEDVADYLYNLLDGCIIVAHNIGFDYVFLNESFVDAGLPPLTQKGIDTVELTKILYPTCHSYRLSDLSKQFDIDHTNIHDAAGDARATAELFLLLMKKAVELPLVTLEKLAQLAGHTQKDTSLFFDSCLTMALEIKAELSDDVIVVEGIALKKKTAFNEQTAHRVKETLAIEGFLDPGFLNKLNYRYRPPQAKMMTMIDSFFKDDEAILAIEAPAGMGKTYAYLIPSLLAADPDQKVVISSSTLLLQEQLQATLERLLAHLPFQANVASLKSKTHFIHLERFAKTALDNLSTIDGLVAMSLFVWLTETNTGDLSELSNSHQTSALLEAVSYQYNDEPIDGKWHEVDFLYHYHQEAEKASILVTNHAFLTHHFDMIKELSKIKKPYLLVDEAHRLPDIYQENKSVSLPITMSKRKIEKFSTDVRTYREHLESRATQSFPHYELINVEFALGQLAMSLESLEDYLSEQTKNDMIDRKINLDSAVIADVFFKRTLKKINHHIDEVVLTAKRYLDSTVSYEESEFNKRVQNLIIKVEKLSYHLLSFADISEFDYVSLELDMQAVHLFYSLKKANWNSGHQLQEQIQETFLKTAYISATLMTEEAKGYSARKLGIEKLADYTCSFKNEIQKNMTILVPSDIPNLHETDYQKWTKSIARFIVETATESPHKMLMLFNANQALEDVFNHVRSNAAYRDNEIEVLAQGFSGSRKRIFRRFSESSQAVLLGSGMYWEGIDFPDQSIDVLVITRLPFESPASPENIAISGYLESVSKNSFKQDLLPKMLSKFMQGIGRINRKDSDEGLVICLDNRILASSYAYKIKKLLPSGSELITMSLENVEAKIKEFTKKERD